MESGRTVNTPGVVQAPVGTPRTVLAANGVLKPLELEAVMLSCDGVNDTFGQLLVELCFCDFTTLGTSSPVPFATTVYGRDNPGWLGAAYAFTTEPTNCTVLQSFELASASGKPLKLRFAKSRRPDAPLGAGFTLRCTMPGSPGIPVVASPTPPSLGGEVGVYASMLVS